MTDWDMKLDIWDTLVIFVPETAIQVLMNFLIAVVDVLFLNGKIPNMVSRSSRLHR